MLCITDDENLMPIYQFEKIESFTEYVLEIPIESYSNISKTLTFEKISFKLIHFNSELERLEKLKVSWRIGFNSGMTMDTIKKELIQLYMIAQTVSSPEFDIIVDNWKDVTGSYPNTYDLSKVKDKEIFYKCIGLYNNETWGGCVKAKSFKNDPTCGYKYLNFVNCGSNYSGGAFCAPYMWQKTSQHVQLGMRPNNLDGCSSACPVTPRFCHEIGHSWGGNDDGIFNYATSVDRNPFVIPTLAYILQRDFVYYDILPKKNQIRTGYTKVEVWCIKHADKFSEDFINRIKENKDARNNKVTRINNAWWLEKEQIIRTQSSDFESQIADAGGGRNWFCKI